MNKAQLIYIRAFHIVVTWEAKDKITDNFNNIYFQIINLTYLPIVLRSEKVNDIDANTINSNPVISVLDSNNFIVIWSQLNSGSYKLYGKIFSNDGSKIGEAFQASIESNFDINFSLTTMDNLIIVSFVIKSKNESNFYARIYDNFGQKIVNEFKINTFPGSSDSYISSSALSNYALFSWTETNSDGKRYLVYEKFNLSNSPPSKCTSILENSKQ